MIRAYDKLPAVEVVMELVISKDYGQNFSL